jgi:uncharacterized membrane protein YeaQ/YmgE (transglycosylase-associated protein family)
MQPFFIIPQVFVGTFVGTFAGALVENFVGAWVGTLVGAWVGALVGMLVGELVGITGTSSRSPCWFSADSRPSTSPLTPLTTLAETASVRKVPSPFVRSVTDGSDGATFSSCARAGSTFPTKNRENGGKSLVRLRAQGSGLGARASHLLMDHSWNAGAWIYLMTEEEHDHRPTPKKGRE